MTTPDTVSKIADDAWAWLVQTRPYYAARAGVVPDRISTLDEDEVRAGAETAAGLLARLRAVEIAAGDEDLATTLEHELEGEANEPDFLGVLPVAAPYTTMHRLTLVADMLIAPLPADQIEARERLTADLAELIHSIAARLRGQHARGVAAPRAARPGTVETWNRLRSSLPQSLTPAQSTARLDALLADDLPRAIGDVLDAYREGDRLARDRVGLADLPGGEEAYRWLVRRQTTLDTTPEELHELGVEEVGRLAERMAELRAELGGPVDEAAGRAWIIGQPHLYAASPEEALARYREVVERAEPEVAKLFHRLPRAPYEVVRLAPSGEAGMTYGYYQPPSPNDPVGRYYFNGSGLAERSQLNAVALILHELLPGHHLQIARVAEDTRLHPLQRQVHLIAFCEGWGEYASALGWEMGLYEDRWDAYGRLSHERFIAQRLVVDTALNLGWWDLEKARAYMFANTIEGSALVATETLRYATDMPAQALAYRRGFLAFEEARSAGAGIDVRDVHDAMLDGGTVPLARMQERVRRVALAR
jgi:uncharacterized protein (DUF885 family)